jgi:hypothetical protein
MISSRNGIIPAISEVEFIAVNYPAMGALAIGSGISAAGASTRPGMNAAAVNIAALAAVFAGTKTMVEA